MCGSTESDGEFIADVNELAIQISRTVVAQKCNAEKCTPNCKASTRNDSRSPAEMDASKNYVSWRSMRKSSRWKCAKAAQKSPLIKSTTRLDFSRIETDQRVVESSIVIISQLYINKINDDQSSLNLHRVVRCVYIHYTQIV